jgi:hypothetical protein
LNEPRVSLVDINLDPAGLKDVLTINLSLEADPPARDDDRLGPFAEHSRPPAKRTVAQNIVLKLAHEPKRHYFIGLIDVYVSCKTGLMLAPTNVIGKDNELCVGACLLFGSLNGLFVILDCKKTK